jgi:hypothetical protein
MEFLLDSVLELRTLVESILGGFVMAQSPIIKKTLYVAVSFIWELPASILGLWIFST